MKPMPVLLLYGIDEQTLPVDADVTLHSVQRMQQVLHSNGWTVKTCAVTDDVESALRPFPPPGWLVFNLCEGSPSQPFYYATAACELERQGYAYTGSGPVPLHQTQSKPEMKKLLEAQNVLTPKWVAVERAGDLACDFFPAIVKPAAEHCSFGITRDSVVTTVPQAREQVRVMARKYRGGALVEEFLDSEEYGISLWGNGKDLEVFGISVIRYDAFPELCDRLCTFDAKWLPETDAYKKTMPTCPAPLTARLQAELEALAKRAHLACGGRDYSRVDVRLKNDGPMVLDVNLNCAVSENSGFVDTARIMGWDYPAVLDRLLMMAAERMTGPNHRRRSMHSLVRATSTLV